MRLIRSARSLIDNTITQYCQLPVVNTTFYYIYKVNDLKTAFDLLRPYHSTSFNSNAKVNVSLFNLTLNKDLRF